MRIGSAERYRLQRIDARQLGCYHFHETLGHWSGEILGARAWGLGEEGEPLNERPFEVLFSVQDREAIVCSGNRAVAIEAQSIEDAIEHYLGIEARKTADNVG